MTQTTGSVSRTGVNSLSDVVLHSHCSSLDLAKGFCCGRTGFFAASSKRTNDHHLFTTTGSSRDENRVHSSCQARVEDAILHWCVRTAQSLRQMLHFPQSGAPNMEVMSSMFSPDGSTSTPHPLRLAMRTRGQEILYAGHPGPSVTAPTLVRSNLSSTKGMVTPSY
jgi:hypothetical protein